MATVICDRPTSMARLGEDVHIKHGGGPPPTSEIGCPLDVGKL